MNATKPETIPPLVFDSPQYPLMPDELGVRLYGNVSNRLEVSDGEVSYHVALAVPTGLFTLMRDVLKVPPEETVYLAIDRLGERHVFSLMYGTVLVDLWSYSDKSLPEWITHKDYRL